MSRQCGEGRVVRVADAHGSAPVAVRPPAGSGVAAVVRDPWIRLAILVATALLVIFGLDLPGDRLRPILGWTNSVVSLCVSAVAAHGAATRLRGHTARRFWLGMATTLGLIGLGNVIHLVAVIRGGSPDNAIQLVPAAQGFGGAGALVLILVMFTYPVPFSSKWAKLIFGLDMATVMTAAVAFGAFFGAGTSIDTSRGVWPWALSIITGPVLSLMVVFSISKLLLTGTAPFSRLPGLLGLGATSVMAISTGLAPSLGAPPQQHWFFVLDVLANVFVVTCTRSQQLAVTVAAGIPSTRRRAYSVAPYVAVVLAYALLIAALAKRGLELGDWFMVASVAACTGLVIARQLTSFADNHRLLVERRRLTTQLEQLAYHDVLTGLANRALFFRHLERALGEARPVAGTTAVILMDLDDFKPINDDLGHQAGDEVLIAVAQRLLAQVRQSDTAARLGGDEFAVVLTATSPEYVESVVVRIAEAVAQPLTVHGRTVRVGCSVGLAVDTGGVVPAADLVREADLAMYRAKGERKSAAAQRPPVVPRPIRAEELLATDGRSPDRP